MLFATITKPALESNDLFGITNEIELHRNLDEIASSPLMNNLLPVVRASSVWRQVILRGFIEV